MNTLAIAKKKRKDLTLKLIEVERERKSAKATLEGLRSRPRSYANIFGRQMSNWPLLAKKIKAH